MCSNKMWRNHRFLLQGNEKVIYFNFLTFFFFKWIYGLERLRELYNATMSKRHTELREPKRGNSEV